MNKINKNELYKAIGYILLELGIKPGYKGFYCLREAVALFVESLGCDIAYKAVGVQDILPKALYVDVGKRLDMSVENVEKSIRVAINNMWQSVKPGNKTVINGKEYIYPQSKYTNTQIIYTVYKMLISCVALPGNNKSVQDLYDVIVLCQGMDSDDLGQAYCSRDCEQCPKRVK